MPATKTGRSVRRTVEGQKEEERVVRSRTSGGRAVRVEGWGPSRRPPTARRPALLRTSARLEERSRMPSPLHSGTSPG